MAKSVAFPLLLSKHQGHRLLKDTTHEIVIEVSGDTDSLSVQMLYDTVQPVFLKERDALASVIDNFLRDMETTTKSDKKKKFLAKFTKNSTKRIGKMETAVTGCVNAFIAENSSDSDEEEIGMLISTWKFVVRNTWAAKKVAVGAAEIFALGASGVGTAAGVLKLVDLIRDIISLRTDISEAFQPEKTIRKELLAQLKKIKGLKKNKDLKKSHIDAVEKTLKRYDAKLASITKFTKDLAKQLDRLMKGLSALSDPNPKTVRMIEKSINQTLSDIGKLNKALKKGQKIRKSTAIQIGIAKKAAKSDGFFTISNLVGIYDTVKDLPDLRENWKEISFDKAIEWLTSED